MSGITEILLIVAILLGIFMLPRLMSRKPDQVSQERHGSPPLSGRMRFAILASLLWPVLAAFFLKPWNSHWIVFLYIAVGPVALIWGIYWVFSGFRKEGK
ncbi:MAG: hypothetical protein K9N21_09525 [Deltaproteobacteria bacterium]|nr:hypothetical protein [Deltaproteobacteria bacterium]